MHDITERKQAEEELSASRVAALNLMEDAVEARQETERVNAKLRDSNEDLANCCRGPRTAHDRVEEAGERGVREGGTAGGYAVEFEKR